MEREPPHKHHVLVIENDHDIRVALRLALETEGYSVVSATNGKEGLDTLRRIKPPCAILLDMMMPIMGGAEFLKSIASHPSLTSVPVVIVSANDLRSYQFSSQVVAVLPKPIDLAALIKVICKHCRTLKSQPH